MEHGTILCGFGGQGLLFAGQVLAQAALLEGREVSWMPSYGPEMRGGTATCSVVVSDLPIGSPLVDLPDSVVALNPPSMARYEPLLVPGGLLVLNDSLIEAEPTRTDLEVVRLPCTELARAAGDDRLVSIVGLGALVARRPIVGRDAVREAMTELVRRHHPGAGRRGSRRVRCRVRPGDVRLGRRGIGWLAARLESDRPDPARRRQHRDPMPATILLVRHAEKPIGDGPPYGVTIEGVLDPESLTPRGWQRAGALVSLFAPTADPRARVSIVPTPTHLFASKIGADSSSRRPRETLEPLAARLGLMIDTRFLKEQAVEAIDAIREIDGVVLVSWEHRLIPAMAERIVGGPSGRAERLAIRPLRPGLGPRARPVRSRVRLPAGPPDAPRRGSPGPDRSVARGRRRGHVLTEGRPDRAERHWPARGGAP